MQRYTNAGRMHPDSRGAWTLADDAAKDAETLDYIAARMSGREWNSNTLEEIAAAVLESGREIKDSDDSDDSDAATLETQTAGEHAAQLRPFNHADFLAAPEKYKIFRTARVARHVLTHNGENDLPEGAIVGVRFYAVARNQLFRRDEPIYTVIHEGREWGTVYANALADLTL